MKVALRRLLIVPLVAVAGFAGAGLPTYAAASLALDHPPWSDPDIDHPLGAVPVDEVSWWPPGRRYEWTGQSTGTTIERIDPWDPTAVGHLWTGGAAGATGFSAAWLWRGRRPLPHIQAQAG